MACTSCRTHLCKLVMLTLFVWHTLIPPQEVVEFFPFFLVS